MIDAQISRPKADRDYESLDCQTVRRVLGEARQGVKEGLPWWHNFGLRPQNDEMEPVDLFVDVC